MRYRQSRDDVVVHTNFMVWCMYCWVLLWCKELLVFAVGPKILNPAVLDLPESHNRHCDFGHSSTRSPGFHRPSSHSEAEIAHVVAQLEPALCLRTMNSKSSVI